MEVHPIHGASQAFVIPPNQHQHRPRYEEVQAEAMEIDEDDAPYLDLRDARERQAYAIIKNRSFVHTRAFVEE